MIDTTKIKFRWLESNQIAGNKVFRAEYSHFAEMKISSELLKRAEFDVTSQASNLLIQKILNEIYGDIRQKALEVKHRLAIQPQTEATRLINEIIAITEGVSLDKQNR